jgi:hypothetical protein
MLVRMVRMGNLGLLVLIRRRRFCWWGGGEERVVDTVFESADTLVVLR